jgi:hypothetical protein
MKWVPSTRVAALLLHLEERWPVVLDQRREQRAVAPARPPHVLNAGVLAGMRGPSHRGMIRHAQRQAGGMEDEQPQGSVEDLGVWLSVA